ncbi:hypothetical protein KQI69_06255 [Eubacterium sp. MSJ-13]|uniref:hypothetical protein n=1 Tax=Eubacterium sp. MSJ-13 TaxID=2841513 RepID=UPI001C10837B|nr:hypothetical protein [Eubacterium sp. MSJ-13]MBU5478804.1 hypothetical protein [Eubacterium sp. MSJ-13]
MEEKERHKQDIKDSIVGLAQGEIVQRHGEAASQILQAYKGIRVDHNGNLEEFHGRNLKEISNYKVGENADVSRKQQAGFSAELLKESRDNQQAIINNESNRTRTTDGIGRTNDTQYDHVKVDENGNVQNGSGSQMKFLKSSTSKNGQTKYNVIDKMANDKSWDRYDGPIDIPSDQYEGAVNYANEQAQKYEEQAARLRERGCFEKAEQVEEKAKRYRDAQKRVRDSGVSTNEALEARNNPEQFVAKEMLKSGHEAGISAAKGTMVVSGVVSGVKNMCAVVSGEKDLDEAAVDVTKSMVKDGATAYSVANIGTGIKALMHASKSEMIRELGASAVNLPVMLANTTVSVGKNLFRYAKGEIDTEELVLALGQNGMELTGGFLGGTVGLAVGGPIGGAIGSFVGTLLSKVIYNGVTKILHESKISAQRRKTLEQISQEAVYEIGKLKRELRQYAEEKYQEREQLIENLFAEIERTSLENDIDGYISCIDNFGKAFGIELSLNSRKEIDEFMQDENSVLVL